MIKEWIGFDILKYTNFNETWSNTKNPVSVHLNILAHNRFRHNMPAKFNFTINIAHPYKHHKSYLWLIFIISFGIFLTILYLCIYYVKKKQRNRLKKNKMDKNWYNKMLELNYTLTSNSDLEKSSSVVSVDIKKNPIYKNIFL